MRNLKVMGLAVVAMLAMSAVVASAASAASYKSETASPATTYLTGTNEGSHTFTAGTVPVVCKVATGKGSFVSGATSITTSEITYNECTVAGQAATVAMNGCKYKFGEPTGSGSPYTVKTVTIECSGSNTIVITAKTAGCTIKVGSQTTSGTSTATNNAGPPKTVTLNAAIKTIKYTSSGGICGTAGTFETGSYEGKLQVKGFSNEAHTTATGIFIS